MPRLIDNPILTQGLVLPDPSTLAISPPDIQAKFNTLEDIEANAVSALGGAKVAESSAREDYDNAKTDLANLEERAAADRTGADFSRQIAAAKEKVERARKRLDAKAVETAAAILHLNIIREVTGTCSRKLEGTRTYQPRPRDHGDVDYFGERNDFVGLDTKRVEAKVPKGATRPAATSAVIAQHALRVDIANADSSRDYVESHLFDGLDKAARRGEIGVYIGDDGLGDDDARHPSIEWPTVALRTPSNPDGSRVMAIDIEALVARHLGDAIKAEIRAKLDRRYAGVTLTLTPAEKARKLREIDAKLLELERIECALTWEAIRNGEDVFFRADADPRAVLGIA